MNGQAVSHAASVTTISATQAGAAVLELVAAATYAKRAVSSGAQAATSRRELRGTGGDPGAGRPGVHCLRQASGTRASHPHAPHAPRLNAGGELARAELAHRRRVLAETLFFVWFAAPSAWGPPRWIIPGTALAASENSPVGLWGAEVLAIIYK